MEFVVDSRGISSVAERMYASQERTFFLILVIAEGMIMDL
jgi:hypothetical protein